MCLAVPGRVLTVRGDDMARMARVDFGGVVRDVSLALVPEARTGAYVVVHVGVAIGVVDEDEAHRTMVELAALQGKLRDRGA